MRDEVKAGIFCLSLVLLCGGLFSVYHPITWTVGQRVALPPLPVFNDAPPPAQFEQFIARYGPPTFEEQSPRGILYPPLFTKWLDYEPENVRVAFVAAALSQPPSRPTWLVISFIDTAGTQPISPEEAGRRLMSRQNSAQIPSVK
jgi:hypothetical protein